MSIRIHADLKRALAAARFSAGQFFRFVAVGLVNTLLTAVLYLVAVHFWSHTSAYFLAFATVLVLGVVLQARVTFGVRLRGSLFALSAIFYVGLYLVNAAVLEVAVRGFGVDKRLAIIVVIIIGVPTSFLVNRMIFAGKPKYGR